MFFLLNKKHIALWKTVYSMKYLYNTYYEFTLIVLCTTTHIYISNVKIENI